MQFKTWFALNSTINTKALEMRNDIQNLFVVNVIFDDLSESVFNLILTFEFFGLFESISNHLFGNSCQLCRIEAIAFGTRIGF